MLDRNACGQMFAKNNARQQWCYKTKTQSTYADMGYRVIQWGQNITYSESMK